MASLKRGSSRRASRLVTLVGLALLSAACGERSASRGASGGADAEPTVAAESASRTGGSGTAQTLAGTAPAKRELRRENLPASMEACFDCHRAAIESYLDHGMSESIGPPGEVPEGRIENPHTGMSYALRRSADGTAWLDGINRAGGRRTQRVVGRIGAGVFDISWATEEVDPWSGTRTGRLFFAPVETITGRGLELSPFAQAESSLGLDFPLVDSCLTCHTLSRVQQLPGADTDPGRTQLFPAHAMGSDAFEHLESLSCSACHGDPTRHVDIMEGRVLAEADDLGIERLAESPIARQRDRCARCHLQGEARFELVRDLQLDEPIAGQFPVLISTAEPDDDFRFVGQVERLALSECFQQSAEMTCTTCHDAHTGVVEQGVESFEAACLQCHEGLAEHSVEARAATPVETIAGAPSRTELGCIDCHIRRSQPFDLPHVRTSDHYIRAEISLPEDHIPHRQHVDRTAGLTLYDDGSLGGALDTPTGELWQTGLEAMGLVTLGQIEAAAERFARFPAPGTEEARTPPSASGTLVPLQQFSHFHHLRGLTLMASGEPRDAMAAFSDALTIDPHAPSPRLARAQLRFDLGDVRGALLDTEEIVQLYPEADAPWRLRASMVSRQGRPDFAAMALERATELWPSDPQLWRQLGASAQAAQRVEVATEAFAKADELDPSGGR